MTYIISPSPQYGKKKKQTQVHKTKKVKKENIFSWYQNGYLFHKIWIEIKSNFDPV